MGHSSALRLGDVRRVFRLLGDCRDLGHDRQAWVSRAIAGLRDELGAVVATGFLEDDSRKLAPTTEGNFCDFGWPTAGDRADWLALLGTGRFLSYPTVLGFRRATGKVVVRSRDQMVPDRKWRLSDERNADRRPLGQDEVLLGCFRPLGLAGLRQSFSINRAEGGRRFGARDRAVFRLFLEEARALSGTALAVDATGPFADLTPRAREVLAALVEGEGEKQIAALLGVSRHTVHDYVKVLYRRFGVSSRGELLAAYRRFARPSC